MTKDKCIQVERHGCDLIYDASGVNDVWESPYPGSKTVSKYYFGFYLYVDSENPTWWKIIPAYED